MAVQRYYYSDTITDFLSRSENEIVGALTLASQYDINDETSQSWQEEIESLKEVLPPYTGKGSVYLMTQGQVSDILMYEVRCEIMNEIKTL